ncbi:hypothetical protein D3C84_1043710 [compost metagenome]
MPAPVMPVKHMCPGSFSPRLFCPAGLSCALRKNIPSVAVRVGISAEPSPMGLPFAFPTGVACSEKVEARFSVDFVCG